MTQITRFNRATAKSLRPTLQEALAAVAAEYGIDIEVKGARFSDTSCTYKLQCSVIGEEGEVKTPEARALELYHPELVNQLCLMDEYKIVGFRTRASKRPLIIERLSDGKKFTYAMIRI